MIYVILILIALAALYVYAALSSNSGEIETFDSNLASDDEFETIKAELKRELSETPAKTKKTRKAPSRAKKVSSKK